MINCTYDQWIETACSNPSFCSNTYGFVSCSNIPLIITIISAITICTFVLFCVYSYVNKTNKNDERRL